MVTLTIIEWLYWQYISNIWQTLHAWHWYKITVEPKHFSMAVKQNLSTIAITLHERGTACCCHVQAFHPRTTITIYCITAQKNTIQKQPNIRFKATAQTHSCFLKQVHIIVTVPWPISRFLCLSAAHSYLFLRSRYLEGETFNTVVWSTCCQPVKTLPSWSSLSLLHSVFVILCSFT